MSSSSEAVSWVSLDRWREIVGAAQHCIKVGAWLIHRLTNLFTNIQVCTVVVLAMVNQIIVKVGKYINSALMRSLLII
jgi:hypothetical protein